MKRLVEVKAKNPQELEMELESIKADLNDFGPEGFYAVPYNRFRSEFPEFSDNIIKSFLLDMGILTAKEYANVDTLGDEEGNYWETGRLIFPEDWDTLTDGAERLLTTRKEKGIQWEKIYPTHYNALKEDLQSDLNHDVYDALSDVAYDYEVNKGEAVYVDNFEKAEQNFNDKFFDGLTRDDYDESLNEAAGGSYYVQDEDDDVVKTFGSEKAAINYAKKLAKKDGYEYSVVFWDDDDSTFIGKYGPNDESLNEDSNADFSWEEDLLKSLVDQYFSPEGLEQYRAEGYSSDEYSELLNTMANDPLGEDGVWNVLEDPRFDEADFADFIYDGKTGYDAALAFVSKYFKERLDNFVGKFD